MDEKEILENNKNILNKIKEVNDEIEILNVSKLSLEKEIIPPCQYCKYDGVWTRCDACEDSNYEGFNVKNYPTWEA